MSAAASAAYNNPQSSPQSPNPTHIANMPSSPSSTSTSTFTPLVLISILLTTILALAIGIYMSGQADDLGRYFAKKYYSAEAKAEATALQKAGWGKAEGFLKDRLKKNPVVGHEELNEISEGLGDEARKEEGLAEGIGRAFD